MESQQTLNDYLIQAASDNPTPGGGAISALVGALGTCMASMAANFTVGRKKYADVEEEIQAILSALEQDRAALLQCMQDDEVAFGAVGDAYKLPKKSEEQKATRTEAIQKSLVAAMDVPLRVMQICNQCLDRLPRLCSIGNPNLVSDTGVAAVCLEAALRAAFLNVEINVAQIRDKTLAHDTKNEAEQLCSKGKNTLDATLGIFYEKLS